MIDNFYDKMLEISNKSELVFCNEEEAYAFAKLRSDNMDEVAAAIHKVLEPRDRILVITCGALPVHVTKFDYEKSVVRLSIKTDVPQLTGEQIVDTNGCGDCNFAYFTLLFFFVDLIKFNSFCFLVVFVFLKIFNFK